MKETERKREIIEILKKRNFIGVEELSKLLYTSQSSIRRDLNDLQAQGLIKRNHGGVMIFETKNAAPVAYRWEAQKNEKKLIAKQASVLLKDNTTVFLDSSTTAYYMVEYITKKRGISVITNSLKTAQLLIDNGIKTFCLGGEIMPASSTVCGNYASEQLTLYHADIMFFSSFALSDDGTISDSCAEENAIRRQMLAQSDYRVFLCDSSKFNKKATHRLCSVKDVESCFYDKTPKINL